MTLADLLAGIVVVSLNAYVLLAGADFCGGVWDPDFGGGVWDLLARGPRAREQRAVIAEAIGPVWEANHVWLILALVLIFTCFPAVFAQLGLRLHIPFALVLVGIVLRGSAFAFRSYGGQRDEAQRRWGRLFAIASLITPVVLGTAVGAFASGKIRERGMGNGERFYDLYVGTWLTPFALSVGVFALVAFAFLAAVYLTLEARDQELREEFRRRGLAAGVALGFAGLVTLLLARGGAPRVAEGLVFAPWALPLHLVTAAAALTALWALWRRRYRIARIAAAGQVSLIFWGWPLSQYPDLLPPDYAIADVAAPDATLRLALGAVALGAVVLLPSLRYLFKVFKRREPLADV